MKIYPENNYISAFSGTKVNSVTKMNEDNPPKCIYSTSQLYITQKRWQVFGYKINIA